MKRDRKKGKGQEATFVIGRNAVTELLRHSPEQVLHLYSSKSSLESEIEQFCRQHKLEVRELESDQLSKLVGSDSHQGLAAEREPRSFVSVKEFLKTADQRSLVVLLDSIQDPQNLGSILRACECFGVDAVGWNQRNSTPLTPVAAKASVGASELLTLLEAKNLAQSMELFKQQGYWIVAADCAADAGSLFEFEISERMVLLLGSEGQGISRLLLDNADFRLSIPQHRTRVDSLNVSQAAAIFLSYLTRNI